MFKRTALLSVVALAAAGVTSVSACQYCRMAAEAEAFPSTLRTERSGEERLDAVINKMGGQSPEIAPMTVATSAMDLPKRPARLQPVTAAPSAVRSSKLDVADAGFLGLAVVGSIFWWRTRRFNR